VTEYKITVARIETDARDAQDKEICVTFQVERAPISFQMPIFLNTHDPEAVLICFRLQMQLLHKKSLICTKTLGSIGAMTSASQRSGLEFRFERGVSLGLKSFIARLDEFRTGVAL
jgi:hypothetical protein